MDSSRDDRRRRDGRARRLAIDRRHRSADDGGACLDPAAWREPAPDTSVDDRAGDADDLVAGAVAGNLHGVVRATKDVDLLIPRDPANTARLLQALSALPYGVAASSDSVQRLPGQ